MYIAFRWLVSLALTMWLAMCLTNTFLKESKQLGDPASTIPFGFTFKNISEPKDSRSTSKGNFHQLYNREQTAQHLLMFVAGALAVSALFKKQEIIRFIKSKLTKKNIVRSFLRTLVNLKYPATKFGATIAAKYLLTFWEKVKTLRHMYDNISLNSLKTTQSIRQLKSYTATLTKLKENAEEKKKLCQLLMSAVQENKNIRTQFQLETLAKKRLAQHIENTNVQIKDNRSRYVSFQHLYLVTHQENLFLKARITKLQNEKEESENNLMELINEVYKTKNNELKSYCSRYIVKTKDNLLNSDVNLEIQKFLKKAPNTPGVFSSCHTEKSKVQIASAKTLPHCVGSRISEILLDDSLMPLVSDSPKRNDLPGEYVWTVKDKDGIIEKLYEYDYNIESDFDSGDTVRKIRQYSVYYDKDCLLDFTNSIKEREGNSETSDCRRQYLNVEHPSRRLKIVSGSAAFKNFLRNNKSLMPPSSSSTPR